MTIVPIGRTENASVDIQRRTLPTEAACGRVLLALGYLARDGITATEARTLAALLVVAAAEAERT